MFLSFEDKNVEDNTEEVLIRDVQGQLGAEDFSDMLPYLK